jgi:hypothetical protein
MVTQTSKAKYIIPADMVNDLAIKYRSYTQEMADTAEAVLGSVEGENFANIRLEIASLRAKKEIIVEILTNGGISIDELML